MILRLAWLSTDFSLARVEVVELGLRYGEHMAHLQILKKFQIKSNKADKCIIKMSSISKSSRTYHAFLQFSHNPVILWYAACAVVVLHCGLEFQSGRNYRSQIFPNLTQNLGDQLCRCLLYRNEQYIVSISLIRWIIIISFHGLNKRCLPDLFFKLKFRWLVDFCNCSLAAIHGLVKYLIVFFFHLLPLIVPLSPPPTPLAELGCIPIMP